MSRIAAQFAGWILFGEACMQRQRQRPRHIGDDVGDDIGSGEQRERLSKNSDRTRRSISAISGAVPPCPNETVLNQCPISNHLTCTNG